MREPTCQQEAMAAAWEQWRDRLYESNEDPRVVLKRAFEQGYHKATLDMMNAMADWRSRAPASDPQGEGV